MSDRWLMNIVADEDRLRERLRHDHVRLPGSAADVRDPGAGLKLGLDALKGRIQFCTNMGLVTWTEHGADRAEHGARMVFLTRCRRRRRKPVRRDAAQRNGPR